MKPIRPIWNEGENYRHCQVDLSSPEFEDDDMVSPPTPTGSFSGGIEPVRNDRATSPPLEKDEKEFIQTARGMQRRTMSVDVEMSGGVPSESRS